jgi:hypothetical protein
MAPSDELRTKLHETGHYVWYNRLSNSQRKEWERLHAVGNYVSEYAKTDALEDFAETYASYMMGERSLRYSRKFGFLRKIE